jgi:hypothetical protein
MLPCAGSSLGLVAVEGHRDTARRFWNRVPEVWGLFGAELSRRRRARSGRISRLYESMTLGGECGGCGRAGSPSVASGGGLRWWLAPGGLVRTGGEGSAVDRTGESGEHRGYGLKDVGVVIRSLAQYSLRCTAMPNACRNGVDFLPSGAVVQVVM